MSAETIMLALTVVEQAMALGGQVGALVRRNRAGLPVTLDELRAAQAADDQASAALQAEIDAQLAARRATPPGSMA